MKVERTQDRTRVSLWIKGEIPTKVHYQMGRGRVWVPREAKRWREMIAVLVRNALEASHEYVLRFVVFWVMSNRNKPDLDSAYHQIQDALSKDVTGKGDELVEGFVVRRQNLRKREKPCYYVEGSYEKLEN